MFWVLIAWILAFLVHWIILYCVSVEEVNYGNSEIKKKEFSNRNKET